MAGGGELQKATAGAGEAWEGRVAGAGEALGDRGVRGVRRPGAGDYTRSHFSST